MKTLRDAEQRKAYEASQPVSDYVRDPIYNAIFDVRDPEHSNRVITPKTLSPLERHSLSTLHRSPARLLREDANGMDADHDHQIESAEVPENELTRNSESSSPASVPA